MAFSPDARRSHYSLFHVGALRFGVHGIGGILCTILTEICRRWIQKHEDAYGALRLVSATGLATSGNHSEPFPKVWMILVPLLMMNQAGNFALATHAATLLPQVPHQTAILTWPVRIVAPHREAFIRTMGMMQYLVVRVVCKIVLGLLRITPGSGSNGWERSITLACLAIPYFGRLVPRSLAWTNGNTWIFVLPIWFGTTGDWISFALWGDVIAIHQLLQVQLVGLGLAFGFTLAFRHYLPMSVVYAVAAWRVAEIIREGWVTIKAA